MIKKICEFCKKEFWVKPYKIDTAKFCSLKCKNKFQKGKPLSGETKRKIGKANKGKKKPCSAEHRKKIGEANKGRIPSKKTREKMSKSHIGIHLGSKNPMWINGKYKNFQGYTSIYKPEHPFNNHSYVLEHRLVAEKHLGRYLTPKEVVHHINEIRDNNRIENLMVFRNAGYHCAFHRWGYCNPKYIVFDGRKL